MLQRYILVLFVLSLSWTAGSAQEKCGTTKLEELLQQHYPQRAGKAVFEHWLAKLKQQRRNSQRSQQLATYTIPVVVHVIHNGEALGVGANIPLSQIESQLAILNQDFQRLNTSQIESLPEAFKAVAGNANIEFVLARQDPEGLPTSGVVRLQGGQSGYQLSDDLALKKVSHWPSSDYLNLYSANLLGSLLGYAQFPETNVVDGLDDVGFRSEPTDGVVINYKYFGQGNNANSGSLGRTATHEVGHYLGLRHIWGDKDGCEADDFVSDTPLQDKQTGGGCPPQTTESCGGPNMYQNYMDYSDDNCMALFTIEQAERMQIVLENSPDRVSLLSSPGLQEAVQLANDAGLNQLQFTITDPCLRSFTPTIRLRNYGSNTLQSAELEIRLNGTLLATESLADLALPELAEKEITLSTIDPQAPGRNLLQVQVTKANGTADQKEINNLQEIEIYNPATEVVPSLHAFDNSLEPFYAINPDSYYTWQHSVNNTAGNTTGNGLASINFYDYELNLGAEDLLVSPKFNFSQQQTAFLTFRTAYAQYNSNSQDGLQVYVSTDCSESLATAKLVYQKKGAELATAPLTELPFSPTSDVDWRTEIIDLTAFVGMNDIQLIFVGLNDYGNNLYLDDIAVIDAPPDLVDLAVQTIFSPSVVSTNTNPEVLLQLRNNGFKEIKGIQLSYAINGGSEKVLNLPELSIAPQSSIQLSPIAFSNLADATYILRINAEILNDVDQIPQNNVQEKRFTVNNVADIIPTRLRFDNNSLPSGWISTSPRPAETGWLITNDPYPGSGKNKVAKAQFSSPQGMAEKWLVSPVLNVEDPDEAGMQFQYSYATKGNAFDALQVRASTDGGLSYPDILFDLSGSELARKSSQSPEDSSENWTSAFLNLERYLGEPNLRLAFVAINGGGNPIYLDNIELIPSNEKINYFFFDGAELILYPNPTTTDWNLVFDLKEREEVRVLLTNVRGETVKVFTYPLTLNQVQTLSTEGIEPGLYFLHIRSASLNKTIRGIITR